MTLSSVRGLRASRAGVALGLVCSLLVLYQPPPPLLARPRGPLPVLPLGAPRVSSAADATAARLAPGLRRAVSSAGTPDALLPVIVVSQGPLPAGLLPVGVARRPDAHGRVFTAGRLPAGQVAALAR